MFEKDSSLTDLEKTIATYVYRKVYDSLSELVKCAVRDEVRKAEKWGNCMTNTVVLPDYPERSGNAWHAQEKRDLKREIRIAFDTIAKLHERSVHSIICKFVEEMDIEAHGHRARKSYRVRDIANFIR